MVENRAMEAMRNRGNKRAAHGKKGSMIAHTKIIGEKLPTTGRVLDLVSSLARHAARRQGKESLLISRDVTRVYPGRGDCVALRDRLLT
eukprot:765641-Rhodomonas_salina.1